MTGVLSQLARNDNKIILESGGFEENFFFVSNNDQQTYEVKGFHTNHSQAFDPDTGFTTDGRNISISVNFQTFNDVNYPLYKLDNPSEINLRNDKVSFFDSNNIIQNFIVERSMPDYSLNHITLLLTPLTENKPKPKRGFSNVGAFNQALGKHPRNINKKHF